MVQCDYIMILGDMNFDSLKNNIGSRSFDDFCTDIGLKRGDSFCSSHIDCTYYQEMTAKQSVIMVAYVIGQTIIFSSCGYFYLLLSSSFFFSSPNLSSRRLDVYHTSTHGVALV